MFDFVLLYEDLPLLKLISVADSCTSLSLYPPLDIFNGMPFFVPAINSHKHSWPSLFYNIFLLQLIYKDMNMM